MMTIETKNTISYLQSPSAQAISLYLVILKICKTLNKIRIMTLNYHYFNLTYNNIGIVNFYYKFLLQKKDFKKFCRNLYIKKLTRKIIIFYAIFRLSAVATCGILNFKKKGLFIYERRVIL